MRPWYKREKWFDEEMTWGAGMDLHRWVFGFVYFGWGNWCLSFGPFYIEHQELPF